MSQTIEGVYRNGKIELAKIPKDLREGPVRITLVETLPRGTEPKFLQYGKYQTGRLSTEMDFRDAEWRGKDLLEHFTFERSSSRRS